ncbi:[LysW]-aminoadipate kinase [Herpetosiphon gulosus]|uniref:Putative [LysW]-aminoadipate kinase n=1 Tax=Herpetosiphon gulosus TaxID=1973496 RepID=A0ABP9X3S2_9CHLR
MLVIKIGGAAGIDYSNLCADIAGLAAQGQPIVLFHGGSDGANTLGEQLGHPPRFITSPSGHTSRQTDRRTLEIFMMATALLNRQFVERLRGLGVNALGLSGIDGGLLQGTRKTNVRAVENGRVRVIRDDWTGSIDQVNRGLLQTLLSAGYLPVIAPLAVSKAGEPLNIDGDRGAASVAAALEAETLLLLTNVSGLYRNFPDESSLIDRLPRTELAQATEKLAQGRMKKKLLGAQTALEAGVHRVIIGDGRRDQPISAALAGHGTIIE